MKNTYITVGIVLSVILVVIAMILNTYNKAVGYENNIDQAASGIEVQEKRQHDLILQLVQVVEKATEFESGVQTQVAELRTAAPSASVGDVMTMIAAVAEAYPDLKSVSTFNQLMTEMSISENLKAQYRESYNTDVRNYKTFVRRQPNRLFLNMVGYEVQDYEFLNFEGTDLPADLFSE